MKMTKYFLLCCFIILILFFLIDCGGISGGDKESPGSYTVTVKWNPNKEKLVNKTNGGYRIYYSKKSGFYLNDPGVYVKEITYISGQLAPTSATLTLTDGKWYIKVIAYMELDGEQTSLPSNEENIYLP